MDPHDACRLARELLDQHGLTGWQVELDRAKRRGGVCHYGRRTIGLSAPLTALHSEAEVRDTILHEVAHALAGPRHGHDATWRAIAVRIGGTGARCLPDDAPTPPAPWLGTCPAGHTVDRHRRPVRVTTCRRCSPRFDLAHLLHWTHRGAVAVMHPNYEQELAVLRAGDRPTRLGPGTRVRITLPGEWQGTVATVAKVGRTRYHLRIRRGVLTVPFAGVEPA